MEEEDWKIFLLQIIKISMVSNIFVVIFICSVDFSCKFVDNLLEYCVIKNTCCATHNYFVFSFTLLQNNEHINSVYSLMRLTVYIIVEKRGKALIW